MIRDKALFSESKRRIIYTTKLRQKVLQTPNISLSEFISLIQYDENLSQYPLYISVKLRPGSRF